jgi:hypothetical protein
MIGPGSQQDFWSVNLIYCSHYALRSLAIIDTVLCLCTQIIDTVEIHHTPAQRYISFLQEARDDVVDVMSCHVMAAYELYAKAMG